MRRHSARPHRLLFPLLSVALAAVLLPGLARTQTAAAMGAAVLDEDAILVGTNQQWQLEPAGNGYYKIMNRNSGLVLGISGASTTAGATALQWGDNLTPDHLWSVVDAGGGSSKLVNKNSGLLLGVQNASTAAGAATLQWSDNGTPDHLWNLTPTG